MNAPYLYGIILVFGLLIDNLFDGFRRLLPIQILEYNLCFAHNLSKNDLHFFSEIQNPFGG